MIAIVRRFRNWVIVEGVLALIVVLPAAAVFTHRAYAPIFLVMSVPAASGAAHWRRLFRLFGDGHAVFAPAKAAILAMAALAAWTEIAGLWSPAPGALTHGLSLGAAALCSYLLVAEVLAREEETIRNFRIAFLASSILALGLLAFEAASGGYLRLVTPPADLSPDRFKDITALGRGFTALLPSLFGACALIGAAAAGKNGRARAGLIAAIAALFLIALLTALRLTLTVNTLAILLGAGGALAGYVRPRISISLLTFAFIAALALAPLLAFLPADALAAEFAGAAPVSWLQRLYIWQAAAREAIACLPFGCGADYARALSGDGVMISVPGSALALPLMPIHPHNAFLQIWLELGLPGVVFAAIFLVAGGRLLRDAGLGRTTTAGLVGAGAASLVFASIEMSIWQEWRLAAIGIAAAGLALARRFASDGRRPHGAGSSHA